MIRIVGIIVLISVIMNNVNAQVMLNQSLGNFEKVEKKDKEFTFKTDFGIAKVIIYSPNIIRIRIEKELFIKTFSYAVIAKPQECQVKVSETEDKYVIQTDSLTLQIRKKPLRFAFYNTEGALINIDDPSFGTSWLGSEVTTYKLLQHRERFIGLGEHTGNLDRIGDSFVNYNTDNPSYDNNSKSLYSTVPFYIGLHNNMCYGIFMDNSFRSIFNFGAANSRFMSFKADGGEMDYYFIYQRNVRKIIESYTWLTGRMPMPPVWALGYQQCRYSYFPASSLISVAQKFRERNIPADLIYLDIHYMDKFKLFTWDPARFPNPKQTIDQLNKLAFHLTVIVDPGVKIEKGYDAFEDGFKNDIFIKYPDGTPYQGEVWPGWCYFPDFTMPKAREWWGKWIKTFVDVGVTGFWNDMNEIAAWGKDVPNLMTMNWEGNTTSYKEGKNVYGFLMARSSYEGAVKYLNGKRPFVLTRAGYSGMQRYTAIWTGDNQATNEHMFLGVRLLNSMGISGLAYTGMDIGGFSGNTNPKLYSRWMQIGAFTPMFREHTAINTNHEEPWAFGELIEDITRRYMGLRYQLLPYIYSSFFEATQNGMPVMRSLAIDYSFDPNIYRTNFQEQYLFGPSILVAPVKSTDELAKVYLPEGDWFDLFTDRVYTGGQSVLIDAPIEQMPLFVKAGGIIPMHKIVESTKEDPGDTLFIHLYAGSKSNQFVYYEDDGETFEYTRGHFYKREISYNPGDRFIRFEKKEGDFVSGYKVISLMLHGFNIKELQKINAQGNPLAAIQEFHRFFISNFKFADHGPDDTKQIIRVSLENTDNQLVVKW